MTWHYHSDIYGETGLSKLDAAPGIQYGSPVYTILRALCLALCLIVAGAGSVMAKDQSSDSGKSSSRQSDKSKKKSSDKSKKKSSETSKSKSKSKSKKSKSDAEGKAKYSGGFRSLAWGTALADVPGLEVREQAGDAKYCALPGDDMDFDGVTMREIVYVFCKNRLAGALMRYDGVVTHQALLGKLTELHGSPKESPPNSVDDRSWRFDDGKATLMVEYSNRGATGAVAYFAVGLFSPCEGMAAP